MYNVYLYISTNQNINYLLKQQHHKMKNAETERLRLPEVGEYSFVPAAVVIGRCLDQRVAHVFWQKRLRQSGEIALHGVDNVVDGQILHERYFGDT